MPTVKIDGQEIAFTPGETVIQICDRVGIEIPRFCYHERLEVAGNCRMCLVEVKPGPPKPQASCALPAADGQEISTKSPMVKKAREGAMEFLLINHPLDCPICDQGGECDLQDQALYYGNGASRFAEPKRAVEDKNMGPLIKPHMTRCIHCTRCVRFAEDIAGVPELGAVGRGEHTEIMTYDGAPFASEISGNVIDLCPVGALTSKPYAFVARPWELKKTESIDVLDAVGSSIRVDSRAGAVLRILPRLHEGVNVEWLSDKSRYAVDGLKLQRLDTPYIRKDGKLVAASWREAFATITRAMQSVRGSEMAAIAGNQACAESMVVLKDIFTHLKSPHLECRQDGAQIDAADRGSYLMNTSIAGLENADAVLLIGTNPRVEAPLVNTRLRKAYLNNGADIYNLGAEADLTYPVTQLGNAPALLNEMASGKHAVMKALKNAKNPVIIVGVEALANDQGGNVLQACKAIAEKCGAIRDDYNGFNLLQTAAARVGALDVGFVPQKDGYDMVSIVGAIEKKEIKLVYLLGVDEIDMGYLGDAFVIYQGHHGDAGAHRADIILPGAAYTEKDGLYLNTEGRVQRAYQAVKPPADAKEDWKLLYQLATNMGIMLPYDSYDALHAEMAKRYPAFTSRDMLVRTEWVKAKKFAPITLKTFAVAMPNFYRSCAISRASKTMAQCVEALSKQPASHERAA
jgi:NADH-quinone oxidoreductase subunit G